MYILLEACQHPGILRVLYFATLLLDIVFVLVPIGLIVMLMIDFSKAVVSGDEKASKSTKLVGKRILYAILIFSVPWIVNLFMDFLDSAGLHNSYRTCLENAKSKNFDYYDELLEIEEKLLEEQRNAKIAANNIDKNKDKDTNKPNTGNNIGNNNDNDTPIFIPGDNTSNVVIPDGNKNNNTGNTGNSSNTGNTGNSSNTGNTGSSSGNTSGSTGSSSTARNCQISNNAGKKCYSCKATSCTVNYSFKYQEKIRIDECEGSWCYISSKKCYITKGGFANCISSSGNTTGGSTGNTGNSSNTGNSGSSTGSTGNTGSSSGNTGGSSGSSGGSTGSTTVNYGMLRLAANSLVNTVRGEIGRDNSNSRYGGGTSSWCGHFAVWALKNTTMSNGTTLYSYLSKNGSIGVNASGLWPAFQGNRLSYTAFYKGRAYGGSYSPKVGDVVWYQWKNGYCRSNYGKWNGNTICSDHVEIVTGVTGSSITSVGGNSGTPGLVRERTISLSSDVIIAFGTFY